MNDSTNSGATERHPLAPFLPDGARLLMLGSFPPQRKRWSMEFFYPNLQNDMWRIMGHVFHGDGNRFLSPDRRRFERERIESFCREKGIALYDTAEEVVRLRNNASDNFLQVVREADIETLLGRIPLCRDVAATGEKAAATLAGRIGCAVPKVGEWAAAHYAGRDLRLWRMPSSSRAYPRSVEWKSAFYARMFAEAGIR